MEVQMEARYRHSENVIAREIEGELIIVPIASGVSQGDEELYTLNESGRAVWTYLDGTKTLQEIVDALVADYDANSELIARDVRGLVGELLSRHIVVEAGA